MTYMVLSSNTGTPKSSMLIGLSVQNNQFFRGITISGNLHMVPSGKRLRNYGKSQFYSWVIPLFRLGHFQ